MDSQTQSVFTLDCRTSNRRNTEIPSEEKLHDEEDRVKVNIAFNMPALFMFTLKPD